MDTRWKAISYVLLIIISLACLFLFFSIRLQRKNLDQIISAKEQSARLLVESIITSTSRQYRSRIKSFANPKASQSRGEMIRAFAERDRATLFKYSISLFEVLQKENPYFSTMGWALPDHTVFLRVHKPEFYGDDYSKVRADVLQANLKEKQISGFEVGYSGMQYRVIEPVFLEGRFLGTIQFGIKAKLLLDVLKDKIETTPVLAVLEEKCRKAKFSTLPKVDCGDFIIRGEDVSLFNQVDEQLDFTEERQRFTIGNQEYIFLTALVLRDFRQEPIGKVIAPLNITSEVQLTKDFIIYSVLATVGLLLLVFLLLHVSFGSMLEKIFTLNSTLEESNRELAAAKEMVEHQVEERTAELVAANTDLQKEITQRRKAESEKGELEHRLRQAQKMEAIGTLAGGIAHDFNNILSAILGYTELSLLTPPQDPKLTNNLKHIAKAGNRARDLVAQILTFSRQSDATLQPLQAGLVIKEALKFLRATLPTTISIEQEVNAKKCYVAADPTQLHQVVMNLCTNAAHAMSEHGGTLTVNLAEKELDEDETHCFPDIEAGSYVEFTVSDTGCGMSPEVVERVFEPFFTTKEVGEGTGMGLSVVHGIVQVLGGTVTVKSAPGLGSTFRILLPRCEFSSEMIEEIATNGDNLPSGSEKILLVDDEEEVLVPARILLQKLGYTVFSALNGLQALEIFQKEGDFDLVITDYTMPGMTGLELTTELLKLRPGLPIIMCTGYSSGVSEDKALAAGICKFCMKPLNLRHISQGVREVLDGHSSVQGVDQQ